MFKNIFSFVVNVLLVAQVCRAAPEDALKKLKDEMTKTLNNVFVEYSKLADEVKAVSLDTKDEQDSEEVANCVDMTAEEALTGVYTRSDTFVDLMLKISIIEESEIIRCSRASESCLSNLADTLKTYATQIAPMAQRQFDYDSAIVEKQISQIKDCAQSV